MTEQFCSFESQTIAAAKTGDWSSELSAHLAECRICEETRAITSLMNRTAEQLGRREAASDPTRLWLKARFDEQFNDEQRESRAGFWTRSLTGLAAAMTAWAAIQWIPPIIEPHMRVFTASSVTLVLMLTVTIVYFASYRPFKNDGQ